MLVITIEVDSQGSYASFGEHVDLHTMPSDASLAMDVHSSKQRNGDPPCGMDVPLDIVQVESIRGCRGVTSLQDTCPLVHSQASWSNHNMTALKWACFQVVVSLASSPFMIIPNALSIILDFTMTGIFSA